VRAEHGYFADPETGKPLGNLEPIVFCAWCRDGSRDMVLERPILYIDKEGRPWRVPAGSRSNGLSVWLRIIWGIVSPFEPLSRDAAFLHDHLCDIGVPWGLGAELFYDAMRANRVPSGKAFRRWCAVYYIGGPVNWSKKVWRSIKRTFRGWR